MTLVPEVILAREAEMCYLSLAMITDFDVWQENPVSAKEVKTIMAQNTKKISQLLKETIPKIPEKRKCSCKEVLKNAKL